MAEYTMNCEDCKCPVMLEQEFVTCKVCGSSVPLAAAIISLNVQAESRNQLIRPNTIVAAFDGSLKFQTSPKHTLDALEQIPTIRGKKVRRSDVA